MSSNGKRIKIEILAAENDGLLFAKDISKHGISRENLRQAVASGVIEKIDHGVYALKSVLSDDSFILQKKYSEAIFSHETAAYYLGYTTRDPIIYSLTVPSGHNSKLLSNRDVKVYYTKEIQQEDIIEAKTIFGRTIRCFNIEKTICDLCSPRYVGDKDVALEIIKTYARSGKKDVSKLMGYATTETIRKTVRSYMEVLL